MTNDRHERCEVPNQRNLVERDVYAAFVAHLHIIGHSEREFGYPPFLEIYTPRLWEVDGLEEVAVSAEGHLESLFKELTATVTRGLLEHKIEVASVRLRCERIQWLHRGDGPFDDLDLAVNVAKAARNALVHRLVAGIPQTDDHIWAFVEKLHWGESTMCDDFDGPLFPHRPKEVQ